MIEPAWLTAARRDIGQRETIAPNDSPWLRQILAKLSGSWLRGQPYCGSALAYWMQQAGIPYPAAYYRALAWADWGTRLLRPVVGSVVVFERKGGGHVGLAVGRTPDGLLLVLGANQKDRVGIDPFDPKRVKACRWPTPGIENWGWHLDSYLPLLASTGTVSENEA